MLRKTKKWDVRVPRAVLRRYPRSARRGYYYKLDRAQAQWLCAALSRAYVIDDRLIRVYHEPPSEGCGECYWLSGGRSAIKLYARAHIKTVVHEWYHGLEHATKRRYNSDDRSGGSASLAWQFAEQWFETFRRS